MLWHVFGIQHLTRPGDCPVMPADTVSSWLEPFELHDRNPALDVAPTLAAGCHENPTTEGVPR